MTKQFLLVEMKKTRKELKKYLATKPLDLNYKGMLEKDFKKMKKLFAKMENIKKKLKVKTFDNSR